MIIITIHRNGKVKMFQAIKNQYNHGLKIWKDILKITILIPSDINWIFYANIFFM